MVRLRSRSRTPARGFTLIEVLVALFVLSLGLLGLAMLQTLAMRFNTESYSRTQATFLAYDIVDRIRANRIGRLAGAYHVPDQATATAKYQAYKACKTSTCKCEAGTICDAATLALYDVGKWYELQVDNERRLLRGADESELARISTIGTRVIVTVFWKEQDMPAATSQTWEVEL